MMVNLAIKSRRSQLWWLAARSLSFVLRVWPLHRTELQLTVRLIETHRASLLLHPLSLLWQSENTYVIAV